MAGDVNTKAPATKTTNLLMRFCIWILLAFRFRPSHAEERRPQHPSNDRCGDTRGNQPDYSTPWPATPGASLPKPPWWLHRHQPSAVTALPNTNTGVPALEGLPVISMVAPALNFSRRKCLV